MATVVKENAHLHLIIPQQTRKKNFQSGKLTLILATQVSEEAQV